MWLSFCTIGSINQSREVYCDFFGWIWFLTVLFSSCFVYWVVFSTLNDALIANAIFRKLSLTIKGYWDISLFWVDQLYILLSQCNIFVSSHCRIFILPQVRVIDSLIGHFWKRLYPWKCLEIWHFSRWVKWCQKCWLLLYYL